MSVRQLLFRFLVVWTIFIATAWLSEAAIDLAASHGSQVAARATVGFFGALAVCFFAAYTWGKGVERGESDVRATEVPVARERGRELGREETLDAVSQAGILALDKVPNGRYVLDELQTYGKDYLATMTGEFVPGEPAVMRVVQIPGAVADEFSLLPGFIYDFRRDEMYPTGWHVDRIGR